MNEAWSPGRTFSIHTASGPGSVSSCSCTTTSRSSSGWPEGPSGRNVRGVMSRRTVWPPSGRVPPAPSGRWTRPVSGSGRKSLTWSVGPCAGKPASSGPLRVTRRRCAVRSVTAWTVAVRSRSSCWTRAHGARVAVVTKAPEPGSRSGPRPAQKGRGPAPSRWSGPRRQPFGSVAGELLAKRGERLVRGERALGRGLGHRRGVRRGDVVALLGSRGVGLGGLGDLLAVRLPAGVSLRVRGLPRLALRLVALEPLVRLGVEALGVGVVAVLVVLGSHAVERGVELVRAQVDTLVRLLERERDAATLEV